MRCCLCWKIGWSGNKYVELTTVKSTMFLLKMKLPKPLPNPGQAVHTQGHLGNIKNDAAAAQARFQQPKSNTQGKDLSDEQVNKESNKIQQAILANPSYIAYA